MEDMNKMLNMSEITKSQETPQEIYARSTETEKSAILILETLKELQDKINGLKDQELTKANVNQLFSEKKFEIEGLLTEILKGQQEQSEAFKDHGIRYVLSNLSN